MLLEWSKCRRATCWSNCNPKPLNFGSATAKSRYSLAVGFYWAGLGSCQILHCPLVLVVSVFPTTCAALASCVNRNLWTWLTSFPMGICTILSQACLETSAGRKRSYTNRSSFKHILSFFEPVRTACLTGFKELQFSHTRQLKMNSLKGFWNIIS